MDGFNVNAVKVAVEKPLDEGTWSAGYKAELYFGPDAQGIPGADQFKLKQAYVALRAPVGNGIDFKIGRFDPIIGYEVVESGSNPNFARSFGFRLEPLIHTGVLATYQFTDWLGIAGGIANTDELITAGYPGRDPAQDSPSTKTYMASLTLKAPESWGWMSGSSLYGGFIDGVDSTLGAPDNGHHAVNLYVGASVPSPWKHFTFGASYDYLGNNSWANAVAGYMTWQITDQLKANFRGEYAWAGWNPWLNPLTSNGNGDKVTGATVTLDYKLWANVISRLEFRWDHAANGSHPFGTPTTLTAGDFGNEFPEPESFSGGLSNNYTLLLNFIYKF
jgi:hypothetical protein